MDLGVAGARGASKVTETATHPVSAGRAWGGGGGRGLESARPVDPPAASESGQREGHMELPEEPAPEPGGADTVSERRGLSVLLSGFQKELRALLVLAGPAVSQVASAAGRSPRTGSSVTQVAASDFVGWGLGEPAAGHSCANVESLVRLRVRPEARDF